MKDMPQNTTREEEEKTMAKRNLFHPEIAQSETDDLYNGTTIPRLTRPVALSGEGVIKRGTPLTSEDGVTFVKFIPGLGPGTGTGPVATNTANVELTLNYGILGILLFNVDADDEEEASGAVLGISGEFNQNKIEEALDDELDPLDIMLAWGRNIHIEANKTYPAVETFPIG
jgi:hypothetical protein